MIAELFIVVVFIAFIISIYVIFTFIVMAIIVVMNFFINVLETFSKFQFQ